MYISFIDIDKTGLGNQRRAFYCFLNRNSLSPNLAAFYVFRILTAFQGTAFLIIGSAVIGDIYKPVRSTLNYFYGDIIPGAFSQQGTTLIS
jgi:hypothetical protein